MFGVIGTNTTEQKLEVELRRYFQSRALAEVINSGTQPLISRGVRESLTLSGRSDNQVDDWLHCWIHKGLAGQQLKTVMLRYTL